MKLIPTIDTWQSSSNWRAFMDQVRECIEVLDGEVSRETKPFVLVVSTEAGTQFGGVMQPSGILDALAGYVIEHNLTTELNVALAAHRFRAKRAGRLEPPKEGSFASQIALLALSHHLDENS